jgi:hypothetical protein
VVRDEWEELERRQGASLEAPGKFMALGVVATLAFLAWTQFFGKERDAGNVVPAVEAAVVPAPVIEPPRVIEAPASHYQGPPPSLTGRESYVGVYECEVNGQRVVSDRPCAPDAFARMLVIDQPDPREVARQRQMTQSATRSGSSYYASPSGGSSTSRSGGTSGASNEAACEAVDRAIDSLNARMRQRYGAAEGERLRAQWHDLKRQRYELKCGR